ncbi:apolipoprotein N-acyltransferase [Rubrivirga sp.]|uniref:apolipoprotein N-acyltransferase n=1 Tax=Rubrivirga sp. TaxID=1885344 RepID=UPI003C7579A9
MIALSMPPLGLYPLAWVALVPLLMRWSIRKPSLDYARELYALLLTTSCCLGFWLLFNPDPGQAAGGGASLFLTPLPLTIAFVLAGAVKERVGKPLGLVALVLNVLTAEFMTLKLSLSVPWLVLGHTQVEALEFIQIADLGGVLLISLWVLALNITAFLALPRKQLGHDAQPTAIGQQGMYFGVFAALIAIPVVYGSVRTAQSDVPSGFARIAIVQPGIAPREWDAQKAPEKVRYLSSLSDDLLARWNPSALDSSAVARQRGSTGDVGLLIWPQSSIPQMPSAREESRLYQRLSDWGERRGVSLLAGAVVGSSNGEGTAGDMDTAVLFRPGKPTVTYNPMRSVMVTDNSQARGDERVLLDAGGTEIATTVGFESVFGDHVRQFTKSGANLIVVLSRNDLWGRTSGLYQHMMITRLRAIESRRAVVLSTVSGVSAMITPSGNIHETAGWMDQDVVPIEAPIFRHETLYVRHGDWLGAWALGLSLVFNIGVVLITSLYPATMSRRKTSVRAAHT